MGDRKKGRLPLLQRVLEITEEQKKLLSENRLHALAASMKEREEILSRITPPGAGPGPGPAEKALAGRIRDLEADLRTLLEGELQETGKELERLLHCNMARRAYEPRPLISLGERCSRDG